jgi:fluoroacetyl-CoA thioesterase
MPEVFATAFLVGFLDWACIKAIHPHLDLPAEQTVGTHIDVSHIAATPSGFAMTANVKLIEVDGRRLLFEVEAHDGVDLISKGKHERFIIYKEKVDLKMKEKSTKKGTWRSKSCERGIRVSLRMHAHGPRNPSPTRSAVSCNYGPA